MLVAFGMSGFLLYIGIMLVTAIVAKLTGRLTSVDPTEVDAYDE